MQHLLMTLRDVQEQTDRFFGTVSPEEFFAGLSREAVAARR